jgi:hypothetical protein
MANLARIEPETRMQLSSRDRDAVCSCLSFVARIARAVAEVCESATVIDIQPDQPRRRRPTSNRRRATSKREGAR